MRSLAASVLLVSAVSFWALDERPARAETIAEPQVFASDRGLLDILMIAEPGTVEGFKVPGFAPTGWFYTVCRRPPTGNSCPEGHGTARFYGGFRLALQPGDELKIRLINHLPAVPPTSLERIHDDPLLGLNPTNLHTHGLIVAASPNTTSPPAIPVYGDFVLTTLFNYNGGDPATDPAQYDPGAYAQLHAHTDIVYNALSASDYDIRLPGDHPAGAFWIHPHVHGISGNQIAMGMAGIISVGNVASYLCYDEGCFHPVPESSVRHLILKDMQVLAGGFPQYQQNPTFCSGSPAGDGACSGNLANYPGGYWFFTVNGQQFPTIPVSPPRGDVWRIQNASASATYNLELVDNPTRKPIAFQLISVDGIAVHFPVGTTASQVKTAFGDRFQIVDCGARATNFAVEPVCASQMVMMPSTRVEVAVAYRDASGNLVTPPEGASGTLRTTGIVTGPGGDPWPKAIWLPCTSPPRRFRSRPSRYTSTQRRRMRRSRKRA
jgi:FtsP/CotA-like multicopper oxidase with cupredoxin domain